jgi:hypothetical protein
MQRLLTAAGTILLKFQALSIILAIFGRCVGPFLAHRTTKVNYTSCFTFFSHILFYDLADGTSTDRSASFTNGKAQTLLHSDRVDELYFNGDVITGHYHLNAFR